MPDSQIDARRRNLLPGDASRRRPVRGVRVFTDNDQCEEWALFRGGRPKNGLRVTGYVMPAGRYCAITGGHHAVVPKAASGEQGVCSPLDGKTCNAAAYYAGTCSR